MHNDVETCPTRTPALVAGPFFEDLEIGMRSTAPGLTLTSGHAAVHQAIVGDRLALFLDSHTAADVGGFPGQLAHPALVWDVAIGQSTAFTQRVVANLFYRGLAFHRLPVLGDTLRTTTEVVALRQNARREGRRPTGMAVLAIRTVDQADRVVLEFWRCAMLPLGREGVDTARCDDVSAFVADFGAERAQALTAGWDVSAFRRRVGDQPPLQPGDRRDVQDGDVVTAAPELARLTLNVAAVHHDAEAAGGRRLVYGGHTIGIAASQLGRAMPQLMAIAGWHRCDHCAPVFEGDTLTSSFTVDDVQPLPFGGRRVDLRAAVFRKAGDRAAEQVLDWSLVGVAA